MPAPADQRQPHVDAQREDEDPDHDRGEAVQHVEPEAHLLAHRSGDLLTRLVADIEELQNFYLRVVSPIVIALMISLFTFGIFSIFSIGLAWVALTFLILTGLGVPWLSESLSRGLGKQQVKRQRALPRTAHTRHDDKFPARNLQRQIL